MPTPALVLNNRRLQFSQLDRPDQAVGKQIETNASLATRVENLLFGLNTWVEQATGAERAGRLEASRRINHFVQQDTQTIRLNLSNLGLSCLPPNFKMLAQLSRMRGAKPDEQCIQLKGNTFDSETQALLPTLQAECLGRLGIGAPPAHSGVGRIVRAQSLAEQHCRAILDVLGAVQAVTLPRLGAVCQDSMKLVSQITSSDYFLHTHNRYNAAVSRLNSKLRDTGIKLKASRLSALSESSLDMSMEQLAYRVRELQQIQRSIDVAKSGLFSDCSNVANSRKMSLNAALEYHRQASDSCEILDLINRGLQNLALAPGDHELDLFESEINANRNCLQDKPIKGVLQNALFHLLYAEALVSARYKAALTMTQQAEPYFKRLGMVDNRREYCSWLNHTKDNLAALQVEKNLLMAFSKLAHTTKKSLRVEQVSDRMAKAVEELPGDSPYLAALLEHPKKQIRRMVKNRIDYMEPPRSPAFWCTLSKVEVKGILEASTKLQTQAFDAARKGNLSLLHELLEEGVDPQVRDGDGNTLLHAAISAQQPDLVKFLVNTQGLNLNATNKQGKTPFLVAFEAQRLDNATCLIQLGADPDTPAYQDGRTAFLQAVFIADLEKMQFLLKSNADPDARDLQGRKAIHLANMVPMFRFIAQPSAIAGVQRYCREVLKQSDLTEGEKLRQVLQSDARCKFQKIVRNREAHLAYWFDQLEFDQMEPKPD